MSPHKVVFLLSLLLVGLAKAAAGEICTLDNRPGATLFLPYFEVDVQNSPPLHKTLVLITNSSRQGVIAQVVLWSEFGTAVYGFPIYLGGYDQQSFDLHAIVTTGKYPETRLSQQARKRFPHCTSVLSVSSNTPMPQLALGSDIAGFLAGTKEPLHVARKHPGLALARGYMTIDVVRDCTQGYPGVPGYFLPNGQGSATNENVLLGTYAYLDSSRDQEIAQTGRLIALEASGSDPRTSTPGRYTFYKRVVANTAADNREPLGTRHAVQYFTGPAASEVVYWRDSLSLETAVTGSLLPSWAPLGQAQATIFNEDRVGSVLPTTGIEPFPVMTGKTALIPPGTAPFLTTAIDTLNPLFQFGWMNLSLNLPGTGTDVTVSQSWVGVLYWTEDGKAGFLEGTELDSACNPDTGELRLPALPIVTRR